MMDELTDILAYLSDSYDTQKDPRASKMAEYTPIPGPPGLPIIGNAAELDAEVPMRTFCRYADIYGPIYKLRLGGLEKVFVCSVELMQEICDEKRFRKAVEGGALVQVRNGVKDGLFTAYHGEKNWGIAHRVLVPAFGPMSIRGMFDEMHDIASQLVLKWARHGPQHKIHVTDDFTRLTLDTIALCGMGYRFNSYYKDEMHPFVDAMVGFLVESGKRNNRPGIVNSMMRGTNAQYEADIALLKSVSGELVKQRRQHPVDKKDLLNAMLNGRDPKTGEGLSDESIINNMITFLVAGHETTSGLLSFAWVFLLRNSAAYRSAQQEVDQVCGKDPITVEHLSKLTYVDAVLKETLRLAPTAPAFTVRPHDDSEEPVTLGSGKYAISKQTPVIAVLPKIHRDPTVYGEDAEEFKPERMLPETFDKLPPGAWKPFGNGMRGCIGRPFAWQEALLVMAMLLQNFNVQLDDPGYQMAIKQTLTLKPKDFYMRAALREGVDPTRLEARLQASSGSAGGVAPEQIRVEKATANGRPRKPMSVFYGSNTGTCEALARRLATDAASHGFSAVPAPLDAATEKVPKGQPVVIITASFEGQPPDNAQHFVEWLTSLKGNELAGTNFAVFGCGHHDWQATFQRIPKLVDGLAEERGGKRMVQMGFADAAAGDMFTDFDGWEDSLFWPAIEANYGGTAAADSGEPMVNVEISTSSRSTNLRQDVHQAVVEDARVLTAPGEPEKRHLEIQLPTEQQYRAGDYLAVLPVNPEKNCKRAMKRFKLPWDASIVIKASGPTILPTDCLISAYEVLATYVELGQPATKKNVLALAKGSENPAIKAEIEKLAGDLYATEISAKRLSPLDLLERYPNVEIPFGEFLAMLPPMRVRQYSISSSPLANPSTCTLTYSVLDQVALSGHGRFSGVASTYLSRLEPGDNVQVSVRSSAQAFHLPLDQKTPIIMIGAGTGIAPFRGFVQERAAQIGAGRELAKALLFLGCRSPDKDQLYADEFSKWQAMGAVELRYAYSRDPARSDGCKYVQDRLYRDRKEATEIFEAGAKVFICGSRDVGSAVGETLQKMYLERAKEKGHDKTEEDARKWFMQLRNERFATDVFN